MLSIGIRFGQGFDKSTILKMLEFVPNEGFNPNYDFLVIGTSPGGIASAREARLAGKKVAIIRIKRYSPAEAEGFDEDLQNMAEALEISNGSSSPSKVALVSSWVNTKPSLINPKKSSITFDAAVNTKKFLKKSSENSRKVRLSRLDLNNELFKRGKQCRKLMHNATLLGDLAETASKCGWRIVTATKPSSINWKKLTEDIMDYVMKENWTLITELQEENVEIIEGSPTLIDDNSVTVLHSNGSIIKYTAAVICLAMSSECVIPEDIKGAAEFGITYDDFIRMDKEPGKTLIVGSTPEGLECAGILAGCKFPVTVVSQSNILKNYDSEIAQLIVNDLSSIGVKFMKETTLTDIKKTTDDKLLANFTIPESSDNSSIRSDVTKSEKYDTILFAVGRKVNFEGLNVKLAGIECNPSSEKILVDNNGATTISHIYAVGDVVAGISEDFELSELTGKLLGKRLFHDATEVVDYAVIPLVMYTPTEYAFVGISEDAAIFRLGDECIDVYYGDFIPLDFVIPARKGHCFAKIIVYKRSDSIIGLHIFGPEAGEMIQGFAAAIKTGLTMTNLRTIVGITGSKVQEIFKLKEMRALRPEK